ncbi:hypothetical protein MMC08_005090 [Hypocenomyce scalaris]|nr:hypothetical protein [Hypocenomyce scalaris]
MPGPAMSLASMDARSLSIETESETCGGFSHNDKSGETDQKTVQSEQPRTPKRLSRALWHSEDIYQLLDTIGSQVVTHEDGLLLLSASTQLIQVLQRFRSSFTEMRLLRAFNVIISRLHRVRVEPDKAMLLFGIRCAARAGSFEAMERYLNIFGSHDHQLGLSHLLLLLRELRSYLEDQKDQNGWEGRRRKQQLLRILTGLQYDGGSQPDEERQPCVFKTMPKSDIPLWKLYISLLRLLGGKDVVFNEWLRFRRSPPDVANPETVDIGTSQLSDNERLADRIAGCFVRHLVWADDAERAWQVIQDSACNVEVIPGETWSLLLDHPEHIKTWVPAMAEKVLQKYEEDMIKIEVAMGIKWLGGEDGYHVATEIAEELSDSEEPQEILDRVERDVLPGGLKKANGGILATGTHGFRGCLAPRRGTPISSRSSASVIK